MLSIEFCCFQQLNYKLNSRDKQNSPLGAVDLSDLAKLQQRKEAFMKTGAIIIRPWHKHYYCHIQLTLIGKTHNNSTCGKFKINSIHTAKTKAMEEWSDAHDEWDVWLVDECEKLRVRCEAEKKKQSVHTVFN